MAQDCVCLDFVLTIIMRPSFSYFVGLASGVRRKPGGTPGKSYGEKRERAKRDREYVCERERLESAI